MFTITNHLCKIVSCTNVSEKHGKDRVPAINVGIYLVGPQDMLDNFDSGLVTMIWRRPLSTPGEMAKGHSDSFTELRFPFMRDFSWSRKYAGYTLRFRIGATGADDVLLARASKRNRPLRAVPPRDCGFQGAASTAPCFFGFHMSLFDRFHEKCTPDPMTGCWIWFGAQYANGYGELWNGSRNEQAHRISYRLYVGAIPEGFEIDHLCRNTWCVSPFHLEAVTHKENIRRSNALMGINARKDCCKRGHPLSGDNLRIDISGNRQCRICTNWRARGGKRRRKLGRLLLGK